MKYIIARGEEEDANVLRWHPESQIIVEMRPRQFLNLTPTAIFDNNLSGRSLQIVEYLQRRLIAGLPIDIPYLDVDIRLCEVVNHEGRHRAYASMMVGLDRIPVVIYLRDGHRYINKEEADVFKICKRIKSQKCSIRDRSGCDYERIDTFLTME